ncbi:MAG: hypothetical protein FWH20_09845 [Oscillospiraceae bacterium]|nr:hypothetical protein [Oscillospiraceae bacterium]
MNKLSAKLLILMLVLALFSALCTTACTEPVPPRDESEPDPDTAEFEQSDEPETPQDPIEPLEPEPPETPQNPEEPQDPDPTLDPEPQEPAPLTELEEIALFVERFNAMPMYSMLPAFDDISQIPPEHIIIRFYWDILPGTFSDNDPETLAGFEFFVYDEADYERIGAEKIFPDEIIRGFPPEAIVQYMREQFNPDFSAENYDFSVINIGRGPWESEDAFFISHGCKAFWDEAEKAVAFIPLNSAGGGFGVFSDTLAVRELENGLYHVITIDVFHNHGQFPYIEDYFINTVRKNADGSFAIISKQVVDINEITFTDEELDEIRAAFPVTDSEWDLNYVDILTGEVFDDI